MFTGIIECTGTIRLATLSKDILKLSVEAPFTHDLKPGDSVTHNGVCLTVETISANQFTVTIVKETLSKTNLGSLKVNDRVNLERAMLSNSRFDGHFVQGHVDDTLLCSSIKEKNENRIFSFGYDQKFAAWLIEQGSVCINGVSLTVAHLEKRTFSVAIIPFTFEHTTFKFLKEKETVNVEFDVFGKYVARHLSATQKSKRQQI